MLDKFLDYCFIHSTVSARRLIEHDNVVVIGRGSGEQGWQKSSHREVSTRSDSSDSPRSSHGLVLVVDKVLNSKPVLDPFLREKGGTEDNLPEEDGQQKLDEEQPGMGVGGRAGKESME